ncbi:hypothetical protein PoB_001072000 [Plakobranchus ocellatus]|uniref:Uncharacterized protein n=1 Tax=Plakobranchus ocellatus TaxID=259542 RepID=A0AAV3YM85_9GAST|nr:hypothetical protein PoB_001072000 [Plakobranchus ocellatus]
MYTRYYTSGWFWCSTYPQQAGLRFSGPPSSQGSGGGARARDRKLPSYFRASLPSTVLPTPLLYFGYRIVNLKVQIHSGVSLLIQINRPLH